jgi:hypothetical protein
MKKLVFLLAILMYSYANAQCARVYINEHLKGSPICRLSKGDYIELCLDRKEVKGCTRDLYIYDMGYSSGSQTYQLSLDKGWSTHYMTLLINPTTKILGFIIQGQTALYSYYTENEMKERQERENKQRQAQEALYRKSDQEKYSEIDKALRSNNFNLVENLIGELHYPKSYPRYETYMEKNKTRKQQEDKDLLVQLNSLIDSDQPEQAAIDYVQLHYENPSIEGKIMEKLKEKNDELKTSYPISDELLLDFIKNNGNIFRDFNKGKYKMTVTPSGDVFIDGKSIETDSKPIHYKSFGKNNTFVIPVYSDTELEIDISKEKTNDPYYLVVSTNKNVYRTSKGDYYEGNFFKTSILSYKVKTTFSSEVKKNHYRVEQKFMETISVNGIITGNKYKSEIVVPEKRFNKRWPTAVRRSLVVTVGPFFTILRLIETSKIP